MVLWWIGNAVFFLVIIPVLLMILINLLKPARHIELYANDITDHVAQFPPHLEALHELGTTRQLVKEADVYLDRYVRALDQIP